MKETMPQKFADSLDNSILKLANGVNMTKEQIKDVFVEIHITAQQIWEDGYEEGQHDPCKEDHTQ